VSITTSVTVQAPGGDTRGFFVPTLKILQSRVKWSVFGSLGIDTTIYLWYCVYSQPRETNTGSKEMNTPTYELTKSQIRKIDRAAGITQPTDKSFKTRAKKERKPWGILKRDWILSNMKFTTEYQTGLGQGRVDKANELEYTKDRDESAYNLGYYVGYTSYKSDRHGWDAATCERFDSKYIVGN